EEAAQPRIPTTTPAAARRRTAALFRFKSQITNHKFLSGSNTSSISFPKRRAISNASGRLALYLDVSIALTVCRETPSRLASSACDQSRSARRTRSRFFTGFCPARGLRPYFASLLLRQVKQTSHSVKLTVRIDLRSFYAYICRMSARSLRLDDLLDKALA